MDEPKPRYTGSKPYRLIPYSDKDVRGDIGLPSTSLFGTRGFVDSLVHQALSENALTSASKARRAAQTHQAFGNKMNRLAKGYAGIGRCVDIQLCLFQKSNFLRIFLTVPKYLMTFCFSFPDFV